MARGTGTSGIPVVVCFLIWGWSHRCIYFLKIHPAVHLCTFLNEWNAFIKGLLKKKKELCANIHRKKDWKKKKEEEIHPGATCSSFFLRVP